jgi:hypothetical protein
MLLAVARPLTIKDEDIRRLEGLAQSLGDMEARQRPKAEAADYVAQHLGVQRRLVQEWVRLARPASRRNETAERFLCVFDAIARRLSEPLFDSVWSLATAGDRDAFRAATWLLPKVDPSRFDPAVADAQDDVEDDVFATSGVPQEVFDELTDVERAQIDALRKTVLEASSAYERLLKEAQTRLLQRELKQATS